MDYISILIWPLTLMFIIGAAARAILHCLRARSKLRTSNDVTPYLSKPGEASLAHLGDSIGESEELTSLAIPSQAEPVIHLRGTTKLALTNYRDAVQKIYSTIASNQVTVIDLAAADYQVSKRIIDFCTGAALASKGYVYKVSSATMILIPTSSCQS